VNAEESVLVSRWLPYARAIAHHWSTHYGDRQALREAV
jgi:hypothetical protein